MRYDNRSCFSHSEAETEACGREMAWHMPPGSTVSLVGEPGAGKTVFARGFVRAMGVKDPVTSPTFTLVNSYEGRMPDGSRRVLHHFDLYRIQTPEELDEIGWDEYFDGEAVCLVEWPERANGWLPACSFVVSIDRCGDVEMLRSIHISKEGACP